MPRRGPVPHLKLQHDLAVGYTTVAEAQALGTLLDLSPGTRFLDLGAGRGWPGAYVAELSGATIVATDPTFDALVVARQELDRRVGNGPALVLVGDGRALPAPSGSFDAVLHADVFC